MSDSVGRCSFNRGRYVAVCFAGRLLHSVSIAVDAADATITTIEYDASGFANFIITESPQIHDFGQRLNDTSDPGNAGFHQSDFHQSPAEDFEGVDVSGGFVLEFVKDFKVLYCAGDLLGAGGEGVLNRKQQGEILLSGDDLLRLLAEDAGDFRGSVSGSAGGREIAGRCDHGILQISEGNHTGLCCVQIILRRR